MKMRSSVWCVVAALALSSCGSSSSGSSFELKSAFPAATGAVGGWIEDPDAMGFTSKNPAGVEIATTALQAIAAVDGDADPFTKRNFVALGREFYKNTIGGTASKLELRIWQMPSAAVATELYTTLPSEDSRYNNTWLTASYGDAGRYLDTGVSWWYNVRKGAYFIDLMGATPNSAAVKTSAEALLASVVAALP